MCIVRLGVLFFTLFLTACSSVLIKPSSANNQALIDGDVITLQSMQVTVKVQLQDVSIRPSPVEQNYCSFYFEIENHRITTLPVEITDFSLVADDGGEYPAVPSEKIVAELTDSIPYLVPSPYVGFYYVQDQARAFENNQQRSEGYYFASRKPEHLTQQSFPFDAIKPQEQASGTIYFPVELREQSLFRVKFKAGSSSEKQVTVFDFPFVVEKK